MARPLRDELRYADMELRRFVNSQLAEARRLGYPRMASFAKDIARGTISLAPQPEDAGIEAVGKFYWQCCNEIERRVAVVHVTEPYVKHVTARRLGMSIDRYNKVKARVLERLNGFLRGAEAQKKSA